MKAKRLMILAATGLITVSSAIAQSGYHMGPGMIGSYGSGHGMMWGGMGYGMMGGGMGYGMMHGPQWGYRSIPDLTTEQREKIENIQKDLRDKQWDLMKKMHEERWDSDSFYHNGQFDEKSARKNFEVMDKFHEQMFENSLDAMKRIDSVLTPEQRKRMR